MIDDSCDLLQALLQTGMKLFREPLLHVLLLGAALALLFFNVGIGLGQLRFIAAAGVVIIVSSKDRVANCRAN